jgi:chemotaxis protein MotA
VDIATLVGIVAGIGVIIGAILIGGPLGAFINVPGILIVLGGTVAATLIAQHLKIALNAVKVGLNAVFDRSPAVEETIALIEKLASRVRKEGTLALESVKVKDAFMAKGVRLAVDGVAVDTIRTTLVVEMMSMKQRHERGQQVFRFMGATAPAMGMVGTLIGLVQMLRTLDDPSSIGPSMAVALLTTLYGAVLANLLFLPVADKLEQRTRSETVNMRIIIEGIESIVNGENQIIVREKLEGFLAPDTRKSKKKGGG